jgi:hypothetical protein
VTPRLSAARACARSSSTDGVRSAHREGTQTVKQLAEVFETTGRRPTSRPRKRKRRRRS